MRSYRYLFTCALKSLLGKGYLCPSCGSAANEILDRKYLVTSFRRCGDCKLLFRAPTTTAKENAAFYQSDYEEGFTTELPSAAELEHLIATRFEGHEKSYRSYLDVLEALGARPGAKVFDFGCSWGYGSFQLQRAGYAVDAFEISAPRAAFAKERLGINLGPVEQFSSGTYDVFFSAHVIEHVPSVSAMIQQGLSMLKPGGWFIAFTPNGSLQRRATHPRNWSLNWGAVHPQLLDDQFVLHHLTNETLVLASSPYDHALLTRAAAGGRTVGDLGGDELLLAFQKPLNG
jgi:2-polyprenyl-3-methyl-5-hydroxy-6-metoxy-1,4-benzoquinol methylase